jgi:hypothetical protein
MLFDYAHVDATYKQHRLDGKCFLIQAVHQLPNRFEWGVRVIDGSIRAHCEKMVLMRVEKYILQNVLAFAVDWQIIIIMILIKQPSEL